VSAVDPSVAQLLEQLVPLRNYRRPDWDEVLARAAATPPRRRVRRRLVIAFAVLLALVAVGAAVAAALGHGPFSIGSWLHGDPGTPAPKIEQQGFSTRNDSVYAAFPRGTKLRLLQTAFVGGKQFSLLGFRNGSSLCLRLARADEPSEQGVNECVSLRELRASPAPALVASTAYFSLSGGRQLGGLFGFADDTVRVIRVDRSLGGRQEIAPSNNAFLSLRLRPRHESYDPVARVLAVTRDGRRVVVPFSLESELPLPPGTPSYYRVRRVTSLGPRGAETSLPARSIGWLDAREARGDAFRPNLHVFGPGGARVVFSRSIQPDAGSPFRVGVSLIKVGPHPRGFVAGPTWGRTITLRAGQLLLCEAELYPLRPAPIGYLCNTRTNSSTLLPAGHAVMSRPMFREAFSRVSGIAADGVREIDLYLATGRVVPAALRDNVYTVEAPSEQFPAKLVAFDSRHRAIDVQQIDFGNSIVLAPCPAAAIAPARAAARPTRYQRIDLATGRVAGRRILGRTRSAVEQALGAPDATRPRMLLYGGKSPEDAVMTVFFGRQDQATWFRLVGQDALDSRLGYVLRRQPPELQRRIMAAYGSRYSLSFAYGSLPSLMGCGGMFKAESGAELSFGLDPDRPARTFLRLSEPR
jgi:hypothetical protein